MQNNVKHPHRWYAGTTIVLVLALVLACFVYATATIFVISPTPEEALTLGQKYFDSRSSADYDIDTAEKYFAEAFSLDPEYPYVNHELARVAFLRGNFMRAKMFIDREVRLHGDTAPNSYYVRALIEGFMGFYDASIADYETYLAFDPHNWAAINDYAWVLLKAERARDAARATEGGLAYFPGNPWLLNTSAIALYEIGDLERARARAREALVAAQNITEEEWLIAYPGNDPRVAREGIDAFVEAARTNMHTIILASASSTLQ